MQQRLSKLEAAQRLGVSPSTLDRMIRRGELEIEREGRGDRAKVWVLAPGLSSDAPGGQPVDAGPPGHRRVQVGVNNPAVHATSTLPW